jgi:hypothetical protein
MGKQRRVFKRLFIYANFLGLQERGKETINGKQTRGKPSVDKIGFSFLGVEEFFFFFFGCIGN